MALITVLAYGILLYCLFCWFISFCINVVVYLVYLNKIHKSDGRVSEYTNRQYIIYLLDINFLVLFVEIYIINIILLLLTDLKNVPNIFINPF